MSKTEPALKKKLPGISRSAAQAGTVDPTPDEEAPNKHLPVRSSKVPWRQFCRVLQRYEWSSPVVSAARVPRGLER